MLKKIGKSVLWLLGLALICVAGFILLLKVFPRNSIQLVSQLTDYQISVEEAELDLWPLTVSLGRLSVHNDVAIEMLNVKEAKFILDWKGLMLGRNNVWFGHISDGDVDLIASTKSSTNEELGSDEEENALNIHRLLSTLAFQIENVRLRVDQEVYLDIEKLNTSLNTYTGVNASEIEQLIRVDLVYGDGRAAMPIHGTLTSYEVEGQSEIDIKLDSIDVSSLLDVESSQTSIETVENEKTMDWSWLDSVDPISLNLSAQSIDANQLRVTNLESRVVLDQDIQVSNFSATVTTDLASGYSFDSPVNFTASFRPVSSKTSAADLHSQIALGLGDSKINMEGLLNINGLAGTELELNVNASALPLASNEDDSLLVSSEQYLPLRLTTKISVNEDVIHLNDFSASAGISELEGMLKLGHEAGTVASVTGEIHASQLSFKTPQDLQEKAVVVTEPVNKKIFDNQAISWPWGSGMDVDLAVTAERVDINQYSFNNLALPIKLDSRSLEIMDAKANFAEGSLAGSLAMNSIETGAAIDFSADIKGVNLDAAGILPDDQISGGNASGVISLKASGESTQSIADSLQGSVLLDMRDARISNSSLNLIGSDILLETINKLNPFAKSEPFTEVECVVINGLASEGVIDFKKSLVMETDKMAIIGNGKLNLVNEKVDIGFTPKAHGGVGLNAGTVLKLMEIGGSLSNPHPVVSAAGLLKTGVAIGAAMSTGGVSLLADGFISKVPKGTACKRALRAFGDPTLKDAIPTKVNSDEVLLKQDKADLPSIQNEELLPKPNSVVPDLK